MGRSLRLLYKRRKIGFARGFGKEKNAAAGNEERS